MQRDYFTVDQISDMLNIHPKTIQRYIREGKLRAVKIGKGWRVSGHDLSLFLESNQGVDSGAGAVRTITASSVVDISVSGAEDAMRILNPLSAAVVSKPAEFSNSSVHSQYNAGERAVRVTIWGDIRFVSSMLDMIAAITGQENT